MNINSVAAIVADNPALPPSQRGAAEGTPKGDSFARTLERAREKSPENVQDKSQDKTSAQSQAKQEKSQASQRTNPEQPAQRADANENPGAQVEKVKGQPQNLAAPFTVAATGDVHDDMSGVHADREREVETLGAEDQETENPGVAPWLFGMVSATQPEGHQLQGLSAAKEAIQQHHPAGIEKFAQPLESRALAPEAEGETPDLRSVTDSGGTLPPEEQGELLIKQENTARHLQTGALPTSEIPDSKLAEQLDGISRATPGAVHSESTAAVHSAAAPMSGAGSLRQKDALQSSMPPQVLAARIDHPHWGEEFGQRMATLAIRGDNQVSLHLNPRELGPITVDMKLVDNQAQMHFFSQHNQVRQAVEQAIPQLREALGEQGISLGDTSVSQQQTNHSGDGEQQNSFAGNAPDTPAASQQEEDRQPTSVVFEDGRLNLYI